MEALPQGRASRGHLAPPNGRWEASAIDGEIIRHEEVVALLFKVSDIAAALERIEMLLRGQNEEEDDEG
jgi:hypothetical protein